MIAWICSTSGRTALRVRTMDPLQGSQVLAGFTQSLLHAIRGGAAGNVMTGEHSFESQIVVNIVGKGRTEFLQLGQRKVLQLAILLDALLNGVRNCLMRETKWNSSLGQVGRRGHRVHEAFLTSRAHTLKIEDHLPHEAGSNLEREAYCMRSVEERLLRFLQILVVSQW